MPITSSANLDRILRINYAVNSPNCLISALCADSAFSIMSARHSPQYTGTQLTIYTLGGLRVERRRALVADWASRKAEALLVYLAITRRVHERDFLAALLWDDRPTARALANLSVLLTNLRKNVGDFLIARRYTVGLDWDRSIWVDALSFERLLDEIPRTGTTTRTDMAKLEKAIALHAGGFLDGFHITEASGFEEWALFERERLQRLLEEALDALVQGHMARGNIQASIPPARRLLGLNPLREASHRDLMRLLALDGQRNTALAQYDRCFEILNEELGIEPDDETTALYDKIAAGAIDGLVAIPAGPGSTLEPAKGYGPHRLVSHNLPSLPTTFFGRTAELNQISERLDNPACRLLTLVGPGGVGKTRLAIRAASMRTRHYLNGVWFVSLAPLTDLDGVIAAVAQALALDLNDALDPASQLVTHLADQEILLILDNLEHLVDEVVAGLILPLLDYAPHVQILATSRQPARLQAEWLITTSGLPYPVRSEDEHLADYPAVMLFTERAQRLDPGFELSPANRDAVVRICRLADGMPLALEMAAVWTRSLTPESIASSIADSLDALRSIMRDTPERHRSMRAVFESSWLLLSAPEQLAFKHLAVFRGGYTKDAARVAADVAEPLLESLADKSLIQRSVPGRYHHHPLLWQFAQEKLGAVAEEERSRRYKHACYFAGLVQQYETGLSDYQPEALGRLSPEIDNARTAWRMAIRYGWTETLSTMLKGLTYYYSVHKNYSYLSAIELLEELISAMNADPKRFLGPAEDVDRLHLEALRWQGRAFLYRGDQQKAAETLMACYGLAHHLEEPELEGRILCALGYAQLNLGRVQEARASYADALLMAEAIADYRLIGDIHNGMASAALIVGKYDEAYAHYQACHNSFARFENPFLIVGSLQGMADVLHDMGDYEGSEKQLAICMDLCNACDNDFVLTLAWDSQGNLAQRRGRWDEAEQWCKQTLQSFREMAVQEGMGVVQLRLAEICLVRGEVQEAERLATDSLHQAESTKTYHLMVRGHLRLGDVYARQQDWARARQHYAQALTMAMQAGMIPLAMDTLLSIAQMMADTGARELANTLAHHVSTCTAAPYHVSEAARALLEAGAMDAERLNDETMVELALSWLHTSA